eukprot:scaffold133750_cov30-Tisochrysis_lutea.AAC.1
MGDFYKVEFDNYTFHSELPRREETQDQDRTRTECPDLQNERKRHSSLVMKTNVAVERFRVLGRHPLPFFVGASSFRPLFSRSPSRSGSRPRGRR